ncbi:porin family protein [Sulfurovum sp. zt1-1]|uniref:Porin family protein n=1 Tax=Sulfurovum zhangzhouensis TaxID=3019067 RepID=A0ABT7R0C5_9BACT|nr:porin family protein [Sulfurovum zhangzhouensis]MDM5272515.1 porin family protein [Sulfurovum zhangzhouensis]
MKTIIKAATLTTLLSISSVYAGGKMVAPAVSPVAEIKEADINPWYIGVGLVWANVTRDCYCYDLQGNIRDIVRTEDDNWGGIVRLGYDFNQYFGIEARYLNASVLDAFFNTEHYGLYLKPQIPLSERFNLYGLLGYGHTEVDTNCDGIHETFSHNGFSAGIGLEYDLSSKEDDYEHYKNSVNGVPEFDRPFDGHGDQEVEWGLWVDYQNLLHDQGPVKYRSNIVSFGVTYDF